MAQDLTISPARTVLVGGEPSRFTASGGPGGDRLWSVLEAEGGAIQPESGEYLAPRVDQASRFHVRVGSALDPGARAEAVVTVLPRGIFERPQDRGCEAFPFRVPGTGRRFGGNVQVQGWYPPDPLKPCARIITGYDLPVTLRWDPLPDAQAELLSYREGEAVRCLDVTGRSAVTLRPRAPVSGCTLEALRHGYGCAAWKSLVRAFCIGVRGLVPFAGCGDDAGLAGLRAPVGLALLGGGLHNPASFVVADAGSHRLRRFDRDGQPLGAWGRDGEPGYRDGSPDQARFNQPGFLTVNRCFEAPQPYQTSNAFLLSDPGNQVIRQVDAEGRVSTLAGTPGQAGHRDADDPRQALFHNPQGLVMDAEGSLFVADQGNHVLRRISRTGQVTTLAGQPGVPGSQDGAGPQARFGRLAGLAEGADGNLYVVDGHAVRRVSKQGEVTTVLGAPGVSGFRDDWRRGSARLAGISCLDRPSGLCAAWKRLYIADQGNHAVREYDLDAGTLKTLVGDPQAPQVRFGLLRDGIDGPLEPAYGAVLSPQGLAVCERGDLYVATGNGLARICRQGLPRPGPGPGLQLEAHSVVTGQSFPVNFLAPAGVEGQGDSRPISFVLECVNADGTVASRQTGTGFGDRWLASQGCFSQPGLGTVRLRCLTDQGCSLDAWKSVPVKPGSIP